MRSRRSIKFAILMCAIIFFACEKRQTEESDTMQLDRGDAALLRIAEDAQRTLPVFFKQLTRPEAEEHSFCVKYPFITDEGSGIGTEQMWITGIYFKNGLYHGTLAGAPLYVSGLKKGGAVTFNTGLITDWMYVRSGKIAGGYSIKYLLEKIPENRRSDEQRQILKMFE